jgi:hypothetical protein
MWHNLLFYDFIISCTVITDYATARCTGVHKLCIPPRTLAIYKSPSQRRREAIQGLTMLMTPLPPVRNDQVGNPFVRVRPRQSLGTSGLMVDEISSGPSASLQIKIRVDKLV